MRAGSFLSNFVKLPTFAGPVNKAELLSRNNPFEISFGVVSFYFVEQYCSLPKLKVDKDKKKILYCELSEQ
jgi:hypothetical protein